MPLEGRTRDSEDGTGLPLSPQGPGGAGGRAHFTHSGSSLACLWSAGFSGKGMQVACKGRRLRSLFLAFTL